MSSIGLIGLPNSGKSTLFNLLTGSKQRTANFPGITVEKKTGIFTDGISEHSIIDLPGLYTLDALSLDEKVSRDYIFNKNGNNADLFILVVDATNLKKSLYLALQLRELNRKFIIALNMMDVATKRGLDVDITSIEKALNTKIIPIAAAKNEGINDLITSFNSQLSITQEDFTYDKNYQSLIKDPIYVKEKLVEVENILKDSIKKELQKDSFTENLDNIVLHPIFGLITLAIVLLFTFQLLFVWADPFIGYIEFIFEFMGDTILNVMPEGFLRDMLIDGVLAGVGGIVVFVPHIFFLFVLIGILDDFGYLGRAAFLLDYIMRRAGLSGKAVVPLLSSHACAIPGIMGARIIKNPRERTIVMMISPLMSCSARLPVYTLLIAAMIPTSQTILGLSYSGLTLFALYSFGILSSFAIAFIFSKSSAKQAPSYLMMELPGYRTPKFKNIFKDAIRKSLLFIKKAGTVIVVLSMIIWALVTFPGPPENPTESAINYSYAAKIGKTFEPIFKPIGYDWKIVTALIPSFGAREVMVSSLSTVMANDDSVGEDESFVSLKEIMSNQYSLATLFSLMVWFVFSPQCISTFAVLKKETNGYAMPALYGFYSLAMAYGFAWIAYRLGLLFF